MRDWQLPQQTLLAGQIPIALTKHCQLQRGGMCRRQIIFTEFI
jgi:hypothetical protein